MCKSISVYLAFNKLSQQLDATEPETNAFTQRVLASTLWGRGFYSQVSVGNSFTAISQMWRGMCIYPWGPFLRIHAPPFRLTSLAALMHLRAWVLLAKQSAPPQQGCRPAAAEN